MILKHSFEDFKVFELLNNELLASIDEHRASKKHCFALFKVQKKGLTTLDVVRFLSEKLRVPQRFISFAGFKDKHAITTQYFTVKYGKALNLSTNNINLEFVGWVNKPLKPGMIKANEFEIIVRGLSSNRLNIPTELDNVLMPNYFDEQRFSDHNPVVGEFLVRKEFYRACEVLGFGNHKGLHYNVLSRLNKADKRLLRFFVNSFQSLLWNEALKNALKSCVDCYFIKYSQGVLAFPITFNDGWLGIKALMPGFGFKVEESSLKEGNSILRSYYKQIIKLLEDKQLKPDDFVVRSVQGISSEAVPRALFVKPEGLTIKFSRDNVFKGFKAEMRFKLPSGSYGTILAKQLFANINK